MRVLMHFQRTKKGEKPICNFSYEHNEFPNVKTENLMEQRVESSLRNIQEN